MSASLSFPGAALQQSSPAGAYRQAWAAGMRYGGAALASAGLAALSAKLMALTLGPAGTGLMGTLQQIRQTGVVISTWNGQTAIVQGGAAAGPQDRSAFYRTALALVALGVLATGLLVAGGGGGWLPGGWLRGGFADWGFRVWGLVALSCGTVFVSGWMNAAGAWRQAAALQMAGPAVTAGALTVLAPSEATPGLVLDLATAAAAASFALALGFAWARRSDFRGPGPWFSIRMARRFLATAGAAGFSSAFASKTAGLSFVPRTANVFSSLPSTRSTSRAGSLSGDSA